ncbi:DUF397 domain-containing protein [Streptomyces sp. CMB-StM0423]|uniref:DUF397 domain-containing protein n=1 Tax=Streptomyces sp. CMB-StM0423 TaxID=2059884 RepID=UPI000C7098DD|nr:DUF397 domain-containing protein [Streptomyces sp. CMB-StM0423]AUH41730.1 DUF397 domain-containing protein [Streptomyces sp. CMB-StM0423]
MSGTPNPRDLRWISSTYSDAQGGNCVQWASDHACATGEVLVRDSKDQHGPHLTLTREGFAGLVEFAQRHG